MLSCRNPGMRALRGHLWSARGCTQCQAEVPDTDAHTIGAGATVCEETARAACLQTPCRNSYGGRTPSKALLTKSLYLSANVCLIHLKGCNKNSPTTDIARCTTSTLTPLKPLAKYSCSRVKREPELPASSEENEDFCRSFGFLVPAQALDIPCQCWQKDLDIPIPPKQTLSCLPPSHPTTSHLSSLCASSLLLSQTPPCLSHVSLPLLQAIPPTHQQPAWQSWSFFKDVDTTLRPQEAGGAAWRPPSSLQECPHHSAHIRLGVPL